VQLRGFIGGTYQGASPTPDAERAINYYPERTAGASENAIVLAPTPGLVTFATLPGTSVGAIYAEPVSGRVFAISGGIFYEVLSGGTYTAYGAIASGPYSFASNNAGQLMISAGGIGYLFTLSGYHNTTTGVSIAANTLVSIVSLASATACLGSSQCATIDDYLITLVPHSRQFQISSLLDGTQWDGLDFGAASGGPDNIIAFSAAHRELWLFSQSRVEIYVDDGSANFPFARLSGAYLETGCAAAGSVCRMDNTLFWLGQDERGAGIVWKASGYTPQRISNHSVEWFISEYAAAGGLSDATAYAYQDGGHSFYVLHFPSATCEPSATGGMTQGVRNGATWVYDAATNLWHERAYWSNTGTARWAAHLARCHAYGFNRHLVGDWQSGRIYTLSLDAYDDAGSVIRRVRRAPHLTDELRTMFYHELTLAMQVGAGNANDPNPQGFLRYSNDGGLTWGNELACGLGAAGAYQNRVRWTNLGSARRRAFEFATTARVPVTLVDAFLRVTPGLS
jgi:hypothetical protein